MRLCRTHTIHPGGGMNRQDGAARSACGRERIGHAVRQPLCQLWRCISTAGRERWVMNEGDGGDGGAHSSHVRNDQKGGSATPQRRDHM